MDLGHRDTPLRGYHTGWSLQSLTVSHHRKQLIIERLTMSSPEAGSRMDQNNAMLEMSSVVVNTE
jgi:hypothetical protein